MDQNDEASKTTKFAILALLGVFLVAGVGAIVAALGLFSSSSETVKSSSEHAATAPESTKPQATTPESNPLAGAATTPVSVPWPTHATSYLKSVRVASHDGFDRIVFEFDGAAPGYVVQYIPGPPTEDPSDRPVTVKGDKFLLVTMNPASGVSLSGDTYSEVYKGPKRIAGPGSPVAELVQSGDFESVLTWTIGTMGEKPFKVSTLESPTRLVIDVKS